MRERHEATRYLQAERLIFDIGLSDPCSVLGVVSVLNLYVIR